MQTRRLLRTMVKLAACLIVAGSIGDAITLSFNHGGTATYEGTLLYFGFIF
jgi:hypothetical protein